MSSTTSEIQDNEYDPLVEHIVQNVLVQALGGAKLASRWMEKLYLIGCVTISDFVELTPGKLEDIPVGNCNLYKIFKDFIQDKAAITNQFDILDAPDDFWTMLTAEEFRAYRVDYNRTIQSITSHPQPSPRDRFSRNSFASSASTPLQQNVSQRPQNVSHLASMGTFNTPSPAKSIQTINPIVKKTQKIADYPKFSGQRKDWKQFKKDYVAVANSQNYGHVLDLEWAPTQDQEEEYKMDSKYIFQAFTLSWNTGFNYNLVSKHKPLQDGRAVYKEALSYFVGGSYAQIELQAAISNLVNNKLTHSTSNGAEGYNPKFNDYITTIEQVGERLAPNIIRCLYLANIQDELYTTIKDQTGLDKMSLTDVQSLM